MRKFYFEDKKNNIAFSGIVPSNETNCPPFDYFKYTYAVQLYSNCSFILKYKCSEEILERNLRQFALKQTEELVEKLLSSTSQKPEIHKLLTDGTLSYKEQNKLLKGLTLKAADILWLNKEAQELGYLLDVLHEEKYPEKFNEKQKPIVYREEEDSSIEAIGHTEMTEGEMRALLEQRTVVQARIYHKDERWHCFYFTFKGLFGKEGGEFGSKPHYHYLSDKSGITRETLMQRIKECDMPTSKVHIFIEK